MTIAKKPPIVLTIAQPTTAFDAIVAHVAHVPHLQRRPFTS